MTKKTKSYTQLLKAWVAIKNKTQTSAELGCAALAGRVASSKEDDVVDHIYKCKDLYDLKQALRPFLFQKNAGPPVWLSKRCRQHLKDIGVELRTCRSNRDVVQKWFNHHLHGIWDHPGCIADNFVLQPYCYNEFDEVYKAVKKINVALVSRRDEPGFHHPETFIYEFEKSYEVSKGRIGWTADEGWVQG
jgi:hypothetical protein